MLLISVSALGLVMMYRVWSRMATLERTLATLAGRVEALERGLAPRVPEPRVAPAVRPPTLHPEPARVQPAHTVAPRSTAPPPSPPAVRAIEGSKGESLETIIGSRWLLNIGVVAIVIGVAYFEKLAIDNRWINETARVVQGGIVGLLMVWVGRRLIAKGYALYGQMLAGGGLAVLYVAIFAAFNLYHLLGRPLATALMCGVTMMAAWLADRERSQGLAVLAVGGGFATPFLLPTPTDRQFALFSYVAILIAGALYLAHRRAWPALNIVSYGFTLLAVCSWAARFYTSAKYLPTELFLTLFFVMYLYVLRESQRSDHPLAPVARAVLWTNPLFYYLASLLVLNAHSAALLAYLVTVSLAGAIAGLRHRANALRGAEVRFICWLAAMAPLLLWIDAHASREWLAGGLATVLGIYTTHLVATHAARVWRDGRLNRAEIALLHANGLAAFVGAYLLVAASNDAWSAPVAALFSLWHGACALVVARQNREYAFHFAIVAASLLTVAIGLQFDGAWVTMGWAAEGALIAALALRYERPWLRAGGLLLYAVALARVTDLLLQTAPLAQAALFNERAACGLFVVALTGWLAWIHEQHAPVAERRLEVATAVVVALLLLLAVISAEINAFWRIRDAVWTRSEAFNLRLARQMMMSITWAGYATALVVAGIRRRYAPVRYLAFAIFGVTIWKVFLVDLAALDRIYRVLSIVALGVMLLVTSYLYHRFHVRLTSPESVETPAVR